MAFTDNFNRSTLGGNWATVLGTAWITASDLYLKPVSLYAHTAVRVVGSFPNDQYAEVDCEIVGGATDESYPGPATRVDGSGNCYLVRLFPSGPFFYKRVAGTTSYVGEFTATTITADTFYTIKLVSTGTDHECFVDGVSKGTFSDSTLSAGNPGVFCYTGETAGMSRCDDFACTDPIGGAITGTGAIAFAAPGLSGDGNNGGTAPVVYAVNLDGSGATAHVTTDTGTVSSFTESTPFTLECWFKTSSTADQALVASQMTGATGKGIQIGMSGGDGKPMLRLQGAARLQRKSDTALNIGTWEHLAITYDGSTVGSGIQFFRAGVPLASTIINENVPGDMTTTNGFYWGVRNGSEVPFTGALRDVRVWKGMQAHPTQVLALRSEAVTLYTLFDAHASKFAAAASQGVATDGTYIYATENATVVKHQMGGSNVGSFSHGIGGFKNEDPCVVGANLYVPLTNHATEPRLGKIQKIRTSDMVLLDTYDLAEAIWPAAIAAKGGEFWVTTTENDTIYRYDATFVLIGTFTFPVFGDQDTVNWPGYSGLEWIGDYLYGNKHESGTRGLDVAYWTGSAFRAVGAFRHVSSGTTQGMAYDATNSKVYWAARGHSNAVYESTLGGGLIGYWKTDEGTGTALADSSTGGTHDGTMVGAGATWEDDPLAFDGVATVTWPAPLLAGTGSGGGATGTGSVLFGAPGLAGTGTVAPFAVTGTGSVAFARPHLSGVGNIPVLPSVELLIAGAAKRIKAGSLNIAQTANGQDQLTVVVDSLDGAYRPATDAPVTLRQNEVLVFGGFINAPAEAGLGTAVGAHSTTISALDNNLIATRRYFEGTIPAGTLKSDLLVLLPYLEEVTLDPGQLDGPLLPELAIPLGKVDTILDQLTTLTGYLWEISSTLALRMYEPGTDNAPFNVNAGDGNAIGDVVVEENRSANYANRVFLSGGGVIAMAEDVTEQGLHKVWELAVMASEPVPQDAADALVSAWLAKSLVRPKTIRYRTHRAGLHVGQTQVINLSARNVNNTFLITELQGYQLATTETIEWQVTAIEGVVYQTGWRETYKTWSGGGGGVTAFGGGGWGGGLTAVRFTYFLGGVGIDGVRSTTPTWVDASPIQVQVNTVPRGTTSATIVARLRALSPGISVQARLFDVTDNGPCPGLSVVVTDTAWSTVTWTVTLTPGSHFYKLQLLPGAANKDVFAVAYLE